MSRHGSQQRTLLEILGKLRPHWRAEPGLPSRIDSLLSRDRRLGSRDRRLYRELAYTALRYLPWVEPLLDSAPDEAARRIAWLSGDAPVVKPFRDALAGEMPLCPAGAAAKAAVLGTRASDLAPDWLGAECPEAMAPPLQDALLSRAPLWLRLNADDPREVTEEFDALSWKWSESPALPGALRLAPGTDVSKSRAHHQGRVEIQDIGSQLILASVKPSPGGRWLDACAGAGGKSLHLAALLGPEGRVVARDLRASALAELALRADRAGVGSQIRIGDPQDPKDGFDGVLVDAPCSGSGTWRRSPHLRWCTTLKSVRTAADLQLELLRDAARRVRHEGTLAYATCSLCHSENEAVVERFLGSVPGYEPVIPGLRIGPPEPDGDAYFVASFRRL